MQTETKNRMNSIDSSATAISVLLFLSLWWKWNTRSGYAIFYMQTLKQQRTIKLFQSTFLIVLSSLFRNINQKRKALLDMIGKNFKVLLANKSIFWWIVCFSSCPASFLSPEICCDYNVWVRLGHPLLLLPISRVLFVCCSVSREQRMD